MRPVNETYYWDAQAQGKKEEKKEGKKKRRREGRKKKGKKLGAAGEAGGALVIVFI